MKNVFREIKREIDFMATKCLDFPYHIHEDMELVYVINGHGTAYCDGKKYTLKKGSYFLVFPNQAHHYIDCRSGEYILLILKPSVLFCHQELYLKGYPTTAVLCTTEDDDDLVIPLTLALKEYERHGYSTVVEAYLTAFFEKLIPHYDIEKAKVSSDTVLHILQYCHAHYKEDITVTDVADALQISRSSVSHIFSTRLAMSFCDHINALRLADAERLLKNTNYTITEISDIAGFPTTRTFNRVFLKKHGIAPTEYRRQMEI